MDEPTVYQRKPTREQRKAVKKAIKDLKFMLGEYDASYVLCAFVDCVSKLASQGARELRSISVTLNGFFEERIEFI